LRYYIGIDNGVSGSIAILSDDLSYKEFFQTPVFKCLDYQKKKNNINRLDFKKLKLKLEEFKFDNNVIAIIERPMVNPTRFTATKSALRCFEATLVLLEFLNISYTFIDSKDWQKVLLPSDAKGSAELKSVSISIGKRLFPEFKEIIDKQKDADGLLITEYGRRCKL